MTTLTEARKALLKLVDSFPVGSTYAAQAAIVADYLDNQVPLNVENKLLREQLAAQGGVTFGRIGRITPRVQPEIAALFVGRDIQPVAVSVETVWGKSRA